MAVVEIKTNGAIGHIFVNGEEIPGVMSYEINHHGGCRPVLTLHIPAQTLKIVSDDAEIYKEGFAKKVDELLSDESE